MKKRWLFLLFLIVSPAYSETIYEASDLINMAKRSGSLQEKFYREAFLNPEADDIEYSLDIPHICRLFGLKSIADYIPRFSMNLYGLAIDNFPVKTSVGTYNCTFRQGFSSVKLRTFPLVLFEDQKDWVTLDFDFMGSYVGISHRFSVNGLSELPDAAYEEKIGDELYDNLYGLTVKIPWLEARFGLIQNKTVTNIRMSDEGEIEDIRYFIGGNICQLLNAEFRIYSNYLEYYDLAICGKPVIDWLKLKLPFYLNTIVGLVNYDYEHLSDLADGNYRLYLNPQIGFAPYLMATSYLEWQPGISDLSSIHSAKTVLQLYLPIFIDSTNLDRNATIDLSKPGYRINDFVDLWNMIKNFSYSITPNSNTNNLPEVCFGFGIEGGVSYYSDSALTNFGASKPSVTGYYIGAKLKLYWIPAKIELTYRFSFNYMDDLKNYIECYNKPFNQLYLKVVL